MAAFLSELDIRKIGERRWILLGDLVFRSDHYHGLFIAPRGFQTDLASIPRIAYVLYPPVGRYDRAAVIHDASYSNALITVGGQRIFTIKDVGDKLFLEGMEAEKVNRFVRRTMYRMVDVFGSPKSHPLALNRQTAKVRPQMKE